MSLIVSDWVVDEWDVTANGWSGKLNISSIDGQGNLAGTMTIERDDQGRVTGEATTTIAGYWDADSQEAWFVRDMKNILPGNPLPFQVYTGYGYVIEDAGVRHLHLNGFFEGLFNTDMHRFG